MRHSTARHLLAGLGLATALALGSPGLIAAEDRAAVPEKGAQASVLAAFKKEYRAELKRKAPEERRVLAETLLELAAAADDAVRRYVYLDQAAGLAEDAADVGLTLTAIDLLATHYEIERTERAFKAVNGIGRGSKDVAVLADASTACIDIAGDAVAENDAATAGKAVSAAKSLAKNAKMDGLGARADEVGRLVAAFKRMRAGFPAIEKLVRESPANDPVAYAALVRYEAFAVGNFETARDFVAQSSGYGVGYEAAPYDELLLSEGKFDGAPQRRPAVADGWWELAQTEEDPLVRARMLARAALHYEIVLQQEHEHDADEIRKRLDSITYYAWDRGVALTTDFSEFGPANVALATIRGFIAKQKVDTSKSSWRTKLPRFPDVTYAPGVDYYWRLVTNQGEITIRFFPDTAPQHVTNFIYLTELGFFDGLTFHRVIPGFMAQGGDPIGSGSGGPGYFIDGEYDGPPKHDEPGVLSMANTGQPKSDGSQFFLTFRPCPELDGKHTVFGKVTDGMKTVRKLESEGTPAGPPKTKLVIERATIVMK